MIANRDMKPNYIEELNKSQQDAVLYIDGPSLVIAGAGSGKTRVLTYKIAYLLEQGMAPWNVLALTFTNKAAREMKVRIGKIVGDERARYLWMGTFHSVFSRILRTESTALNMNSNFTIYDTSDSRSLIKTILKEMQLSDKEYKPAQVLNFISQAKNHLITPAAYAANSSAYQRDCAAKMPAVRDIYQKYWDRCRAADALDFDDLLFQTYLLFRDNPVILDKYREQFKYILVDEYQDTNFAQHCVVKQLAEKNQKICVVGDDAQSIYSFRGADIDNILQFSDTYKGAKVFKLEQNYRSTQNIVAAANSLIKKNMQQIPKDVFSENMEGNKVQIHEAYSDSEEAEIVAKQIREIKAQQGGDYSDFAILYRTNAQSRLFEETFRKRGIPYKIYGGLSFYQRKEIKDIISYFRLVVNPRDEEAFKRIVNYPTRGIGATTIGKIADAASRHNVSYWEVVNEPLSYNVDINKGTHTKIQKFVDLINSFMEVVETENAYEIATRIIRESGMMSEILIDNSPENLARKENIDELVNGLSEFCSARVEEGDENIFLYDFLSEVSLLTDQDTESEDDINKVTLMTVHASKGLEFRNVFVVGLEMDLFPSNMSGDSPKAMEEERRLFYVALTRAEENCILTYAKSRMKYGKTEVGRPSGFLTEIDPNFVKAAYGVSLARKVGDRAAQVREKISERFSSKQSVSTPSQGSKTLKRVGALPPTHNVATANLYSDIQIGVTVEHERFGIGVVAQLDGEGDNAKATIAFENAGTKQLLLRFARFKVLNK